MAERDKRGIQCQDRLDIEFDNLCYYPPGKKVKSSTQTPILRYVKGKFNSGRLTAILGPSGAGKTSLLNVLTGFKINGVSGSVKVNGKERNVSKFRKLSCYIKQDFAMLALLTTKETMMFAADLKLDSSISKEQKKIIVNQILEILGLEKTVNTLVGKLSGGEKKRLSIGVELLTNPPVMFFDEPTSGLDSLSALQITSHLKSLAEEGRTVVCTIHQPSSQLFEMFDDVYVLSEGQCIYNGPNKSLTDNLKEEGFHCPTFYNRADFAIEIASGQRGDKSKLIDKFKNSEVDTEYQQDGGNEEATRLNLLEPHPPQKLKETVIIIERDVHVTPSYPQPLWSQFLILTRRLLLCTLRDKFCVWLRVLTHIGTGLLIGSLYYGIGNDASKVFNNVSCLFFFVNLLFMCNSAPPVAQIPSETSVVLHEHLNNWYSLKAYFISKLISDIPLQMICPTLLVITGYFTTGQPTDGLRLLQFWTVCLLISVVGHHFGLTIGALISSLEMGVFLICISAFILMIFSGFFAVIRDVPVLLKWLTYVSCYRYAFEGVMQCVYGYNRPDMYCPDIYCYFKSPLKFLDQFDMVDAVYQYDILALIVWILILQVSLFLALKWKVHTLQ
ncbi:ATP-binding cassette sub-family G member 1-like isoform X1 [Periplaneta americana]|uniref:ATP-binding cassette sub-family G member 1-like isoform X1 n=2 Tax=Periplaneta americana TaxID=6978 RepID=UPI0037E83B16